MDELPEGWTEDDDGNVRDEQGRIRENAEGQRFDENGNPEAEEDYDDEMGAYEGPKTLSLKLFYFFLFVKLF